jgi:hypothetical protein
MVNLVQEQVQRQSAQVLAVGTTREIPVGQGPRQVLFPHFRAPVDDRLIHPVPGGLSSAKSTKRISRKPVGSPIARTGSRVR